VTEVYAVIQQLEDEEAFPVSPLRRSVNAGAIRVAFCAIPRAAVRGLLPHSQTLNPER